MGDRFAMLVGKMVIGGAMVWGFSIAIRPVISRIKVRVSWESGDEKEPTSA
jgi:hypothetical protein